LCPWALPARGGNTIGDGVSLTGSAAGRDGAAAGCEAFAPLPVAELGFAAAFGDALAPTFAPDPALGAVAPAARAFAPADAVFEPAPGAGAAAPEVALPAALAGSAEPAEGPPTA
jgi:hypothetical protein